MYQCQPLCCSETPQKGVRKQWNGLLEWCNEILQLFFYMHTSSVGQVTL